MPASPDRTLAQIVNQSIRRAEYFFPGPPTVSNVYEAIARGDADVAALDRLLQITAQVAQEPPSPPFVQPYDPNLDRILKARGWLSRRDERPESHIFDMWTWPPTSRLWSPTVIHHEGRQIRVFYAIAPHPARSPELTFSDADALLAQIHHIESWGRHPVI